jgi:hypothetical protein
MKRLDEIKSLVKEFEEINDYDYNDLLKIAEYDFQYTLFLRALKRNSVLSLSINDIKKEEIILSDLDETFLLEFYRYVESCSSQTKLMKWASILTHEIKNGKSISIRTLHVFNSLDSHEIELFEKIGSRMIGDFIVKIKGNPHKIYDVKKEDLWLLKEAGIIMSDSFTKTISNSIVEGKTQYSIPINSDDSFVFYIPEKEAKIKIDLLTTAGKELLSIDSLFNDKTTKEFHNIISKLLLEYNIKSHEKYVDRNNCFCDYK